MAGHRGGYHARSFLQAQYGRSGNPMSNYTMNEIRGGMKLLIDGDPYAVIENEYVKPGKGQAFNRVRVRNLRTGRTVEKTYRSASPSKPPTSWTRRCSTSTRTATSGLS